METRMVQVASNGEQIGAYLAKPDGQGPFPAVVVIMEVWGLVDHIKDVTERFAREGYVGICPDLFHRTNGPGPIKDMADIMRVVGGLQDRQAVRDMKGSVEYLKAQPYVKKDAIGVVGFCMGGTYSYLLACDSRDIKACIVFYGRMVYKETNQTKPVSPIDRVPDLGCPLLGLFGEADAGIPVADVKLFEERLKQQGKKAEVHVYPGAPHAFFNDTRQDVYRPDAAKDAWTRTLGFYKQHLKR